MVNTKGILTTLLLIFVGASVVHLLVTERNRASQPAKSAASSVRTDGKAPVTVYYFHGNFRCDTCRKIEAYTDGALTSGFSNELAAGALNWQICNVEDPTNDHFVTDFELTTRSVVITGKRNGQPAWTNLSAIWDLVGDQQEFASYIQNETRAFLGGKP